MGEAQGRGREEGERVAMKTKRTEREHIAQAGATYRHFKLDRPELYVVIAIATNTETGEPLVIYTCNGAVWARPRPMFEDGRFTRVEV